MDFELLLLSPLVRPPRRNAGVMYNDGMNNHNGGIINSETSHLMNGGYNHANSAEANHVNYNNADLNNMNYNSDQSNVLRPLKQYAQDNNWNPNDSRNFDYNMYPNDSRNFDYNMQGKYKKIYFLNYFIHTNFGYHHMQYLSCKWGQKCK